MPCQGGMLFYRVLEADIVGFHSINTLYIEDEDLKKVIEDLSLYESFTL